MNSDLFEAMGLERINPLPEWKTVGTDQFWKEYSNRKAVHLFKSPQGWWNARFGTVGYQEPEGILIEPCRKLSTALRRISKEVALRGWLD